MKIGDFTMNSENSEIMTIVPEKRIVRPLVLMATPTAVTTGSALALFARLDELLAEPASG